MQATTQMQNKLSNEQIKFQLISDADFIKKSKINYLNCDLKGLHQGQRLVLVCIDKDCKNKGLICPVCKQQNHKDHEVVHLKIFLTQLQSKLVSKQSQDQDSQNKNTQLIAVKTLSQHLNLLENSRKAIITNLQESVKVLAQAVKDVEKKIQEEYIRVRRVILSQKSFQSRLPKIYSSLLFEDISNQQNRQQMKQQIKKLTQLLQKNPKIDQMKVVNNADKIVELYSKNLQTCTTHLLSLMTDLPKKILQLPIKLKYLIDEQDKNKEKSAKLDYKFNQNLKANPLILGEDFKTISVLGPQQLGGIAFIQAQGQSQQQVRKINLKIVSSISDSISLGVGDVDKMKQINFVVQQMQNDGLFGICAMGININDIQSPTFVFAQGDIIQIQFDAKDSKITFGRRNGVQRQEIQVGYSKQQCQKLRFFVNIVLYGDSVQIVD